MAILYMFVVNVVVKIQINKLIIDLEKDMERQLTQQDLTDRINQLCDEKKWDYITLSRKSGVPLTTLLNIIKGNSKNPGIFTINKLCNGFAITMAEFFK